MPGYNLMPTYTYTDPVTHFVYSYTDTEPTIKDQIRGLIGDIVGAPLWYISDNSIISTATIHQNDLYTAAAECAEKCASRVLSLHQEVQQGRRLKIKNFDPDKAYQAFMALANMLRNKSTNITIPSYGALESQIVSPCLEYTPPGWCE